MTPCCQNKDTPDLAWIVNITCDAHGRPMALKLPDEWYPSTPFTATFLGTGKKTSRAQYTLWLMEVLGDFSPFLIFFYKKS
jgi:hypothetical protein